MYVCASMYFVNVDVVLYMYTLFIFTDITAEKGIGYSLPKSSLSVLQLLVLCHIHIFNYIIIIVRCYHFSGLKLFFTIATS